MNSIIDLVMRQVSRTTTGEIAKLLGLAEQKTGPALQSGLATVLGAMAVGVSKPDAATNLLKHLTAGGFDADMFRDLEKLFTDGQATDDFMKAGGNLIGSLFGSKLTAVTDKLGPSVGLGQEGAHSLLSLVTPLVLSSLGGLVRKDGLNASCVTDLLRGQISFAGKFLPDGMADLIGLTDLGEVADDREVDDYRKVDDDRKVADDRKVDDDRKVADVAVVGEESAEAVAAARTAAGKGSTRIRKLLPWIVIFLLAAIAASVYFGLSRQQAAGTLESAQVVAEPVARHTATGISAIVLPGGEAIRVMENSFNAAFARYLGSGDADLTRIFDFDIVEFETGSSLLTPVSRTHVEDLRKILVAYPEVTIKLIGHTDATGSDDENLALSIRRADAARNVLVREGIAADRITSEGRGATQPIAPNDTEEGRALNRRLELIVTGL